MHSHARQLEVQVLPTQSTARAVVVERFDVAHQLPNLRAELVYA